MDVAALEDLIMAAADHPDKAVCSELTKMLETAGMPLSSDISDKLGLLWEAWSGALNEAQVAFCIFAAAHGTADTPVFRRVFSSAVKKTLPPYLSGAPVMRALGVRDDKQAPIEVAARLKRLLNIKVGTILFMPENKRWGLAGTVDVITGTLPVSAFAGSGAASRIPLELLLPDVILLNPGTEVSRLVEATPRPMAAQMFRMILSRRAVFPVKDADARLMAQCGCARTLSAEDFEKWWGSAAAAAPVAPASAERRSCDGRSPHEMVLLLAAEEKNGAGKFSAEECSAFKSYFSERLTPDVVKRDEKSLAEAVGALFPRLPDGAAREVLSPLIGKVSFWPAKPLITPWAALSIWGSLSAKVLRDLSQATVAVLDPALTDELVMKLPLKALNALLPLMPKGALLGAVRKSRNQTSDIILWVWKNRRKLPDAELLDIVSIDNVAKTLSAEDLPKEWGAARRELSSLLMDNEDFQKRMLEATSGNVDFVCTILQGALFLSSGERQSLIVKLARLSPELRNRLESGAGSKIVNSSADDEAPDVPADIGFYSSARSIRLLDQELEDIINVQIPANREALKTARAHGDFRENSEFDAAKERRNYLSRRRNELERDLANVHPVLMRQVQVTDEAVIGSEIELKYDDGETEVFQLLGAWDGDPQRKFLSYRARLGAVVLHRHVGETFKGPGDRLCTLAAVREISDELKAELDD